MKEKTILVTGGSGFIGFNFVQLLWQEGECSVINLDKLTHRYLSRFDSLSSITSIETLPPSLTSMLC